MTIHLLGYVAALLIGLSLGLIGGGGSILTVPVLVYLFGVSPTTATAYSLFVVGTTSAMSTVNYARQGLLRFRSTVWFALPSVLGIFLMRRLFIPIIPDPIPGIDLAKDKAILVLFAIMMVAASFAMIRRHAESAGDAPNQSRLAIQGFLIGLVTGAVGAGGGFLIVPALVMVAKIPMKQAVATSLAVIALNSAVGFLGDLQSGRIIEWSLVSVVSGLAIAGSFIGTELARHVSGAKLKPAFGGFVLVMGLFVLAKELILR